MQYTSINAMADQLRKNIASSPATAIKAMQRIYQYQTASEKSSKSTQEYNLVGFNGADAPSMSYYCGLLQRGYTLRPDVIAKIQTRMQKYAHQLVQHSIDTGKIKKVNNVYVW